MTDSVSIHDEPDDGGGSVRTALLRQAPYVLALVLAVAGVAYSNLSRQPLVGYWEFLAIAIGAICIFSRWSHADDRNSRLRLIGIMVLHWAAVLVMMNIMVLFHVRSMIPDAALSLVMLAMLALGTFLAGISFLSLQISFLGLAMALTVPAIAWLTQSFVFLLLIAVLLIGVGVAFWPARSSARRGV